MNMSRQGYFALTAALFSLAALGSAAAEAPSPVRARVMAALQPLAARIDDNQGHGKKLMVGDASLVGPACSAWQQLAIGLGANWVEAIEKPQENDVFQRCVLRNPVERAPDGRFALKEKRPRKPQIDE